MCVCVDVTSDTNPWIRTQRWSPCPLGDPIASRGGRIGKGRGGARNEAERSTGAWRRYERTLWMDWSSAGSICTVWRRGQEGKEEGGEKQKRSDGRLITHSRLASPQ